MCRLHFNLVINLTLWWKEILCVRFVALFSVNIRNPYFLKKRGFGHIELAKARWTHPPPPSLFCLLNMFQPSNTIRESIFI